MQRKLQKGIRRGIPDPLRIPLKPLPQFPLEASFASPLTLNARFKYTKVMFPRVTLLSLEFYMHTHAYLCGLILVSIVMLSDEAFIIFWCILEP